MEEPDCGAVDVRCPLKMEGLVGSWKQLEYDYQCSRFNCTHFADIGLANWRSHGRTHRGRRVVFILRSSAFRIARLRYDTRLGRRRTVTGFVIHCPLRWFGRIRLRGVDGPTERLNRTQSRSRPGRLRSWPFWLVQHAL